MKSALQIKWIIIIIIIIIIKLNHMGEVIYYYGMESYWVCQKGRKEEQGPAKSKWQVVIERLIRERRQLKKPWK